MNNEETLFKLHDFPDRFEEWQNLARLAGIADLEEFKKEISHSLGYNSLTKGRAYFLQGEGKIIATAFLKETVFDTDISCTIFHVAVLPELRGKGIGKKLMKSVFQEALVNGKSIVLLFTTTASSFYLACGMTKLGEIPGMIDGESRYFFYKKF